MCVSVRCKRKSVYIWKLKNFFKGIDPQVRPSLSEKSFPVRRVTAKKASREVGILFFLFLIFH